MCEYGVHFRTVEELLKRSTPCVVRGLEQQLHADATEAFAPARLNQLSALFDVRVSRDTQLLAKGPRETCMRFRPRDAHGITPELGLRWETADGSDTWSWKQAQLKKAAGLY